VWRRSSLQSETLGVNPLIHDVSRHRRNWTWKRDILPLDLPRRDGAPQTPRTAFEKNDLHRVLDTMADGPVVLLGTSLGAAVAILEAADDQRVATVVAAETFADLRTVATERAPFFFTASTIRKAFQLAAERGRFDIDAVSPERAAARITVPVLLVHGAADVDTRPEHSQRVFRALRAPKQLMIVPGARHNESLRPDVWPAVENWIDRVVLQPR
jgi:pimeloyl-ACP methyl ester carboxylesterase